MDDRYKKVDTKASKKAHDALVNWSKEYFKERLRDTHTARIIRMKQEKEKRLQKRIAEKALLTAAGEYRESTFEEEYLGCWVANNK